jgi:hypothetical protein
MCVVPRPPSQDPVFKRVYASPGLQCTEKEQTSSAFILGHARHARIVTNIYVHGHAHVSILQRTTFNAYLLDFAHE